MLMDPRIERFNPHLFFAAGESCFPISADAYLAQCDIVVPSWPGFKWPAGQLACYDASKQEIVPDVHLAFRDSDWKRALTGDPEHATCYARVLPRAGKGGADLIVYFYLFSHTEPMKCCGCGFPFVRWSHQGDLKFIAVEVMAGSGTETNYVSRVYFGAHGYQAGEWRERAHVTFSGEHPVAFAVVGDHSFYPEPGRHPRILGFVDDWCGTEIFCRPTAKQVFAATEVGFDPVTMGWCAFPGPISADHIGSPAMATWFKGDIPVESNGWFKRLCCRAWW